MVVPIAPSMMAMRFRSSSSNGCKFGIGIERSAWRVALALACRLGLVGRGQYHFQVRFLGFPTSDFGTGDFEACPGEQGADGFRRKTRVTLAVTRGHLVLLVLVETQQNQPTAGAQDARALRERARWMLGIGQRV